MGFNLYGKTIGVIGTGRIGEAFCHIMQGFGCKVLAYDKFKTNFSDDFVTEASMKRIFEEADIISLHISLTDESSKMVNADYLSRFKKSIYLLNKIAFIIDYY